MIPKPGYKLIFDLQQAQSTKGKSFITEDEVKQVAKNWGKRKVPVTLGHLADYDTKTAAAGWVTDIEVSPDFRKIYGKVDPVEPLTSAIPDEFRSQYEQVQQFAQFAREAINKDYFPNMSMGLSWDTEREGWYMSHLAALGSAAPACGSIDVLEFAQQQTGRPFIMEFSKSQKQKDIAMPAAAVTIDKSKLTNLLSRTKEFAQKAKRQTLVKKYMDFTVDLDPTTMEDKDWAALNDILEALREEYKLDDDASPEMILGAIMAEHAEVDGVTASQQQLGAMVQSGDQYSTNFNRGPKGAPVIPSNTTPTLDVNKLVGQVLEFAKKNFDGAPPAPVAPAAPAAPAPPAPGDPAAGDAPVAVVPTIMQVKPEEATQAAQDFIDAAKAAGTWAPAFDEPQGNVSWPALLTAMDQVQCAGVGTGSLLDALSTLWGSTPKIAEFSLLQQIKSDFPAEFKKYLEFSKSGMKVGADGKLTEVAPTHYPSKGIDGKPQTAYNTEKLKKVKDFQKQNPTMDFGQAYDRCIELGILEESEITK